MKTKDKKEIFSKNLKELKVALRDAKEALFNLNLDRAQDKLKNKRSIFNKKKEIARILTAIREKELLNEEA